ncbi:MAG: YdjY domain-containing protein [Thermoanaerobaculia bacterium]
MLLATHAGAAEPLVVDRAKGEVRIRAIVQPGAMQRWFGVQGHHAVVWDGGNASRWALFRAFASDHDVRVALDSLGATPGENLTVETWTERSNPTSPEPDKRVEGTPIDVFVSWDGRAPVPLASVIRQEGAPSPVFEFRYGGHEKWQPTFKSGCIVCLYSCPGGAVSSRSHTIRDYEKDGVIYFSKPKALPPNGTEVTIILRPRLEAS